MKKKIHSSWLIYPSIVLAVVVVVGTTVRWATATPRFQPGETLNPPCGPTDPDCAVAPPHLSQTYIVSDMTARDQLQGVMIGDHVMVSSIEKIFVLTQGGVWVEFPQPYPNHTHIVANLEELNNLANVHELHIGDHAEVTDLHQSYIYTQDEAWQELLAPVNKTYVVPDLTALNGMTEVRIGDHAEVTGISKSYIRTQDGAWQELLVPPAAVTLERVFVVADDAARAAIVDPHAGDIAIVTDISTSYVYSQDGVWQQLLLPAAESVHSVNGKSGTVILNSDDLLEGGVNAYFTASRARASISANQPLTYQPASGELGLSLESPFVVNGSRLALDPAAVSLGTLGGIVGMTQGGTGLTAPGSADQLLGVNGTGSGLEYKTLTAGSNIAVIGGPGAATIRVVSNPMFEHTTVGNLTIGTGGTSITKHLSGTFANVTTASIAARACGNYATLSLPGVVAGQAVIATPLLVSGGIEASNLSWNAYVAAADTIVIRVCNPTVGAINTPNTQSWVVDVWAH